MTQISKEYANALFALAKESASQEEVFLSLHTVLNCFKQNPEYLDLLDSASIPKKERAEALSQAFSGAVNEWVLNFLQVLCAQGHIRAFEDCVREYQQLLDEEKKISTAQITSAVALSESEKERLKSALESKLGHGVQLECGLDESLMGGIVVRVDGKVLDGSLKRRLGEWKEGMDK